MEPVFTHFSKPITLTCLDHCHDTFGNIRLISECAGQTVLLSLQSGAELLAIIEYYECELFKHGEYTEHSVIITPLVLSFGSVFIYLSKGSTIYRTRELAFSKLREQLEQFGCKTTITKELGRHDYKTAIITKLTWELKL